jgi:hypothetical protein
MASNDGIVLAGDVLFDRVIAGVSQGFVDLNAGEVSIKLNSKTLDIVGKGRNNYGQVIATAIIGQPAELTISFGSASPKALAMGLQGVTSAYTQASGSAVDEVVVANKGGYANLAFRNATAVGLTVKNSAGSTTYVKDTDYTIDYAFGQIFALETGAITDKQSLKVSYTYNAVSANQIDGGTSASVRGKVLVKGRNIFDDVPAEITIWDAVLTSESNIDWLSEKPMEIKLKGRMVVPTGRSGAFELKNNIVNS